MFSLKSGPAILVSYGHSHEGSLDTRSGKHGVGPTRANYGRDTDQADPAGPAVQPCGLLRMGAAAGSLGIGRFFSLPWKPCEAASSCFIVLNIFTM